jgi:hypothetical protein
VLTLIFTFLGRVGKSTVLDPGGQSKTKFKELDNNLPVCKSAAQILEDQRNKFNDVTKDERPLKGRGFELEHRSRTKCS